MRFSATLPIFVALHFAFCNATSALRGGGYNPSTNNDNGKGIVKNNSGSSLLHAAAQTTVEAPNSSHHRELATYNQVLSSLRANEEIATELISRGNGPTSTVGTPSNSGTFLAMQGDKVGSKIEKLLFYVDTRFASNNDKFISGIGAEFSDGTTKFAGSLGETKFTRVEVVTLSKLTGTIKVKPRAKGVDYNIDYIYIEGLDKTIADNGDNAWKNAGSTKVFDVDGRFLTGLVVSTEVGMKTLQFIVTKPTVKSELIDLNYDLGGVELGDAKTLDTITLSNDSSLQQSFEVSFTAIESSTIEFSSEKTRSFEASYEVSTTFEAKVPFVASASATATVGASIGLSISSGKTDTSETVKEVTKTISISVPPQTKTKVLVTQFQEQVADIEFTAKHRLTFKDGTTVILETVNGIMKGVIVSNVQIDVEESALP